MYIINSETGSHYKDGDTYKYKNTTYVLTKRQFKVKSICNKETSILLNMVDNNGLTVVCNFWLSNYGKDPNIMLNGDDYSLVGIKENDVVEMVGFSYDYFGTTQFNPIGGYEVIGINMSYNSAVNKEQCMAELAHLLNIIDNEALYNTCRQALEVYQSDFVSKPAAHSHHHNYIGGLLQHTIEVMKFAYVISTVVECNKDIILTAAFFHDIEKVKEYTLEGDYLPYASNIGHIMGSMMTFNEYAKANGVDSKTIEEIDHCILAHHGRKEWGSPVEPQTPEAKIVHEADMLSAGLNPMYVNKNKELIKDYYIKW